MKEILKVNNLIKKFPKAGYVMNDVRKEGTEEEFYRTIIGEMEKF